MENNIPYGFNDDGKSDIKKIVGSSLGFRNFQTKKANEEREEKEYRDKMKDFPQTIEEADRQMNIIKSNPKAIQ